MPTHLSRLQSEHTRYAKQQDAIAVGRDIRHRLPRSEHGLFAARDRDPLAILAQQNASRVQHLVPLRMGRMLASPFAFYRGTAGIMAADLASEPNTGIRVVSCGDAHLSNFGLFASPQRSMVFDLNDFDEAASGPWEWDLKRLVASVVIGGREAGHGEKQVRRAARHAAESYRTGMLEMMKLDVLERYYFRMDVDAIHPEIDSKTQKVIDRATAQARRRTSRSYLEKVTTRAADGTRMLIEDPPVLTHLPEATETDLERLFERYRRTVPSDINQLLSQFTLTDVAMRVVGVGSVGTRCYILILTGPQQEPLVLQVKEAQTSVLESYGRIEPSPEDEANRPLHAREGHRVVSNQRILQAVSDSFLGYLSVDGRDYYVRQFRDMKGSIDATELRFSGFLTYADACATLLARAHAQSHDAPMIAGYLGSSSSFDRAITEWSIAYAEQSLADYHRLRDAVATGEVEAQL
ncbi:DUF2252 domain-containing protein [Compostimonas suwonensis]|uniref:Uncharacterized protein (DUF2252 family) n=1 Tax=Compostimonas suwonensis TaxID=1048394 RepID=A0A2M9C0N5_9MICO|nr:DUF2252 domain-containing protein [Compostimonas suwonensis]PJJ63884.1 uncharacterized protein (DUF2252 family) [Compostimonas suwonensis]